MRFRVWLVRSYEWCPICKTRVADLGGILCARCKAETELELEKILKEADDA